MEKTTKEKILNFLTEPLAQVEIAEKLNMGQSTVNHYIQLLEAEGKITLVKTIGKRVKIYKKK
jgi:DNA-binding transcriptional regulator LsrR (DeoR family)